MAMQVCMILASSFKLTDSLLLFNVSYFPNPPTRMQDG